MFWYGSCQNQSVLFFPSLLFSRFCLLFFFFRPDRLCFRRRGHFSWTSKAVTRFYFPGSAGGGGGKREECKITISIQLKAPEARPRVRSESHIWKQFSPSGSCHLGWKVGEWGKERRCFLSYRPGWSLPLKRRSVKLCPASPSAPSLLRCPRNANDYFHTLK